MGGRRATPAPKSPRPVCHRAKIGICKLLNAQHEMCDFQHTPRAFCKDHNLLDTGRRTCDPIVMNSTARRIGFGLTLKLLDDTRPVPRTEGLTRSVVEMELGIMERASDPVLVWEDALRGAPAGVDDKGSA